jgi:hypothetical protein
MSDGVLKIRCPYCAGKIGVDSDYYQELIGKIINCPHCSKEMIIPANSESARQNLEGSHSLDRTQEIQVPPQNTHAMRQPSGEARHCPHCGVEVGKRDRVCIACGNKIPLPEPPPGFSQIRA